MGAEVQSGSQAGTLRAVCRVTEGGWTEGGWTAGLGFCKVTVTF